MGRDGSSGLKKPTAKSGQGGMIKIPCCLCNKPILDTLKTVKNHVLRAHIRPLKCGSCGLRFGKTFELNRHRNGVCKNKPQDPQFGSVAEYNTKLHEKLKTRKNKRQIDDLLLEAERGYLDGLKADRGHFDDRKHIDSDQDGDYESDPEFTEHTETHISNGPPPGETLHSKYTQTETWVLGSEYGDNIMDVVPAGEFDRVLGPITPNLEFEMLIWYHYIDQAGMLPSMVI